MLITVLQFRLKAVMTRQHTFLLKCIKLYSSFCKQSYEETSQACKKWWEVQYRNTAFKLMYMHVQYAYTFEWSGLRKEFSPSLPKAQLTHSSFIMLPFSTSFNQHPAGRATSTFTVCDGVSGWQTFPGQWPWQTAACALLPARSSIISSSQLVPLSFYSCCPGICRDTQYCAAATGLFRPEVASRGLTKYRKECNFFLFLLWYQGSTLAPPCHS